MKLSRIIFMGVMIVSVLIYAPSKEVGAAGGLSHHCAALNDPRMDNLWALTATGGPGSPSTTMYAGETIHVSAGPPVALYPTEINLFINDTVIATAPYPGGSITYTLPTDMLVWAVGAHTGSQANGVTWDISCRSAAVGRDMIHIPSQAAVGTFLDWTMLLGSPTPGGVSEYWMAPGQTLYVFGLDSTGQFYQVLLSGDLYWVPVTSMGPNYDRVWNGTPLPTTVVG
jgi:hypothetical protein